MLQGLKEAKFAFGGALDNDPLFRARLSLHLIYTYAAEGVFDGNVLAEEILVARPFIDDALQLVVADAPAALGGLDSDLFEGAADGLGHRTVENAAWPLRKTRAIPSLDGCHDAGFVGLVTEADVEPRISLELRLEILGRAEYQRFNERNAQLLECPLPLEQGGEFFGLLVGQEDRIVHYLGMAFVVPSPGVGVAVEDARTTFDLNQKEALG